MMELVAIGSGKAPKFFGLVIAYHVDDEDEISYHFNRLRKLCSRQLGEYKTETTSGMGFHTAKYMGPDIRIRDEYWCYTNDYPKPMELWI